MTGPIILAVVSAAVIHATWNALLHAITDRLLGFALAGLGGVVCGGLLLPVVGLPAPASWPFLAVSVVLHVGYLGFLMLSFRLGDFGQVYPLARGIAPWTVAIAAALLLGETLAPLQILGIGVVSAGLFSLVFAGGMPGRAQLPALGAALMTGLLIAGYTMFDGVGVRQSDNPLGYAAWLIFLHSALFFTFALLVRRRALFTQLRRYWWKGMLAGALSLLAYALVLWAQTAGSLAAIAALRETSIIFGAAIATLFFREPFGRFRILAAAAVAAGIALLTVAG